MSGGRPRLLVPEVIQTSAMDCGPAVLKAALEGFGWSVHLGHLREACQTDVDGTSIDTLEDLARQLGMAPVQTLVPLAHLARPDCLPLPAVVVTATPDGARHFVLLWRRWRRWVQVMDPAAGRRWMRWDQLAGLLYVHTMAAAPAVAGRWLAAPPVRAGLAARLGALGAGPLLDKVEGFGALDALWQALHTAEALVESGSLSPRDGAAAGLVGALAAAPEPAGGVPSLCRPAGDAVHISGAVVLRLRPPAARPDAPGALGRALSTPGTAVAPALLRLLHRVAPGLLPLGALVALAGALGGVAQAALFRGLVDAARWLPTPAARLGGMGVVLVLQAVVVGIAVAWAALVARAGRRLELHIRRAFHARLPTVALGYFQSRLQSDLAERAHAIAGLKELPGALSRVLTAAAGLLSSLGAVLWLDPGLALPVVVAVLVGFAVPVAVHPLLASRELRRQTHDGALARTYLDAMLGAAPIRAHGAQEAVRRDHEALLSGWQRAARDALHASVAAGALQGAVGIGLAVWMVADHVGRAPHAGAVLLLVYWAVGIPRLGEELARATRALPALQSVAARIFETLDAPVDPGAVAPRALPAALAAGPVGLRAEGLVLRAGGQELLRVAALEIEAGAHVAIVGRSGAGKSTLLGALLGWHQPGPDQLFVGGVAADAALLRALRPRIAWVDPTVRIWNRSLLANLRYGQESAPPPAAELLEEAELIGVVAGLPDGLASPLGADGGTLSGGQGQRVRLGRALGRPDVGLVLLDEAFRGLDGAQRQRLLGRARARWRAATLLCVTHDLAAAARFPRVLVVEDGRVVEDGDPAMLLAEDSRFAAMHRVHGTLRTALGAGADWTRWTLAEGRLQVEPGGPA